MADLAHDGMYLVYFVPTLTNPASPSVAAITAGTALHARMTPGGLKRDASTDSKDTSKLNSTFSTAGAGRRHFDLSIEFVREVGDTSGVEAALVYQANGYIVIRDDKLSSVALAAGDKVEVYPVQVEQPSKSAPAANEDQKITVGFAMTGDPSLGVATVA